MIVYVTSENQPRIGVDTDKWCEVMLPLLKHGDLLYRYEGDSTVSIDSLSKKMVLPILLYTLIDMHKLIKDALPNEPIANELLSFSGRAIETDDYNTVKLEYEHVKFINEHEKEVKAWLPLVIKKYIKPNHTRIKDVISGNI